MLVQDFLVLLMPATAILINHIHIKCSEIIFALRIFLCVCVMDLLLIKKTNLGADMSVVKDRRCNLLLIKRLK